MSASEVGCFIEGFLFKKKIEILRNTANVLHDLEELPILAPSQLRAQNEVEKLMNENFKGLKKLSQCVSEELENTIRFRMSKLDNSLQKEISGKRDWKKFDENLTYLELTMEMW